MGREKGTSAPPPLPTYLERSVKPRARTQHAQQGSNGRGMRKGGDVNDKGPKTYVQQVQYWMYSPRNNKQGNRRDNTGPALKKQDSRTHQPHVARRKNLSPKRQTNRTNANKPVLYMTTAERQTAGDSLLELNTLLSFE